MARDCGGLTLEEIYDDFEPRTDSTMHRDERTIDSRAAMTDEEDDRFNHLFALDLQYLDAFNSRFGAELKEVIAITKGNQIIPAYIFSDQRFPGAYTGEALLNSLELDRNIE